MTARTQTEIYELVNEAFTEFLKKCSEISHAPDCEQVVADSIEDMTTGAMDCLVDIEIVAQRFDEEDDMENGSLDREHERIESAMLRR